MKIAVLSDSHDNRVLLDHAMAQIMSFNVSAVLHCGDVVAPSTLALVQKYKIPVHVIHGNNMGDASMMNKVASKKDSVIQYHGQDAMLTLHQRRIFIVHYPIYANALATTGEWDVVCCGHNHRADVRKIDNIKKGHTWVVNPGSVGGIDAKPTFIIGDLTKMEFNIYPVAVDSGILDTKSGEN